MFSKDGPTFFELIQQALSSTQRGYDLLAPKFDATPFRTPDEMIASAVPAIGEADALLDVCCGTGAGMRLLRPICRRRIVGMDFSPGMLQQAKQKLEEAQGTAKVEFVEGDVMQMTFHEEFDVVTCFGAQGHILPGAEGAFLRVIHRALRPNGRFVFFTTYPPPPLSLWSMAGRSFNAIMKIRNALLKPPFIMYYFTFLLPQIVEKLKKEGFSIEVRSGVYREYCLVMASRASGSIHSA